MNGLSRFEIFWADILMYIARDVMVRYWMWLMIIPSDDADIHNYFFGYT